MITAQTFYFGLILAFFAGIFISAVWYGAKKEKPGKIKSNVTFDEIDFLTKDHKKISRS